MWKGNVVRIYEPHHSGDRGLRHSPLHQAALKSRKQFVGSIRRDRPVAVAARVRYYEQRCPCGKLP